MSWFSDDAPRTFRPMDRKAILDDIVAILREDEPATPEALEEGLLTLGRLGLLVR